MSIARQMVELAHEEVDRVGCRAAPRRRIMPVLVLGLVALSLQACREDEQQRPLTYAPGTYQGQPDQKLDEHQIEALRQRATGHQL